ncbi:MAG: transposase [Pyrinomonadaceae bacterium]|nr:transposase [Sphingobacteriaceae bacterium]
MLITTNEYKDIHNPKQYGCYAGVAPCAEKSGLFKGKGRGLHMANNKVKPSSISQPWLPYSITPT